MNRAIAIMRGKNPMIKTEHLAHGVPLKDTRISTGLPEVIFKP